MSTDEHGDATVTPAMGPITREESAKQWGKTAEDILKTLPEPSLQPLPSEQASDLGKYKNKPGITAEKAWENCAGAMRKYDADTCKAYREELDTLLVFAGLFSAVVTAFTVESYKWLYDDSNDVIISLLSQIAHVEGAILPPNSPPDGVSVRINRYWFLSLSLALLAALLAILCKQWVREFERDAHQSHEQFISIRQMKLEGFAQWGVGSVVAAVPLLLEGALGLFMLGMMELLYSLNIGISIIVFIPVVAGVLLYATTAILPAVQVLGGEWKIRRLAQCPFKSPHATLTVVLFLTFLELYGVFVEPLVYLICLVFRPRTSPHQTGPSDRSYRGLRDQWVRRIQQARSFQILLRMFQDMEPWLRFDLEYTRFRDAAYTLSEYRVAIGKNLDLPPSLRFQALRWLLLHVDQPAMRTWTWMCVWDMATKIHESDPLRELNALQIRYGTVVDELTSDQLRKINTPRFEDGIREILAIFSDGRHGSTPSVPCAMALRYGLHAGLEPQFIAEAFIHLLPSLNVPLACEIYLWIRSKLGEDDKYMRSVVGAVLTLPARTTVTEEGGDTRDLRALLVTVGSEVSRFHPPCVSLRERACAVALYFSELRTQNVSLFDARGDLQELLVATIASCVDEQGTSGDHPAISIPADERAVLVALARAVDQVFDELGDPGRDDRRAAADLAIPSYRRVYLDLLTTDGHATKAVLEERFERNIAPLALAYSADEQRSPGVASLHADLGPARESSNEGAPTGTTPGIQIIITAPDAEHPSTAGSYTAPREERTMSGAPHALQALDVADTPLPVTGPS